MTDKTKITVAIGGREVCFEGDFSDEFISDIFKAITMGLVTKPAPRRAETRLNKAFAEGQQAFAAGDPRNPPHQPSLDAETAWFEGYDEAAVGNYFAFAGFPEGFTDDGTRSDGSTYTPGGGGANNPPSAVDDSVSVLATDAVAVLDLRGNDTDPDTDPLTIFAVDATGVTGTVDLNGGTVSYDPNGQFAALAPTASAIDTFTYTITDGNGGTDTATVNVTIAGVNEPPPPTVGVTESFTVDQGGSATEDNLAGDSTLLTNDIGQNLSVNPVPVVAPLYGALILRADGTFDYDHDDSENFTDSFTYEVIGDGGNDTVVVNITIAPGLPVLNWGKAWVGHTENENGYTIDINGTPPDFSNSDFNPGVTAGDKIILLFRIAAGGDAFLADVPNYGTPMITANDAGASRGSQVYQRVATGDANDQPVIPPWTDGGFIGYMVLVVPASQTIVDVAHSGLPVAAAGNSFTTPLVTPAAALGTEIGVLIADSDTAWDKPVGQANMASPDGNQVIRYNSDSTRPSIHVFANAHDTLPPGDISFQQDSVDVGTIVETWTFRLTGPISYASGATTVPGGVTPAGTGVFEPPITPNTVADLATHIIARPRMVPGGVAALQAKLNDTAYDSIRPDAQANASGLNSLRALNYLVWNDVTQGNLAVAALLAGGHMGEAGYHDKTNTSDAWVKMLVWDWCNDLITGNDRVTAMGVLKAAFNAITLDYVEKFRNDNQSRGPMHKTLLALAMFGEGDLDTDTHILNCYRNADNWTPFKDGAIEVYKALDCAGGNQHGCKNYWFTGYESFFIVGALGLPMWDAATGDNVLAEVNPWNHWAKFIAQQYYHTQHLLPANGGMAMIENMTGIADDANDKALAKHFLDEWGTPNVFNLTDRLLFGDLRVVAQSPDTLALPTNANFPQHDMVQFRQNFTALADVVRFTGRQKSLRRYPLDPGGALWYRNGEAILPGGALGKGGYAYKFMSSPVAWRNGYQAMVSESGSPFDVANFPVYGSPWFTTKPNNTWPSATRALTPIDYYDAAKPWHAENDIVSHVPNANGFDVQVNLALALYLENVAAADRHASYDDLTKTLNIRDVWTGFPTDARVAMMFALPSAPDMSQAGSGIVSWLSAGGTYTVTLTYVGSVAVDIDVVGGVGQELLGPFGPAGEYQWMHSYGKLADPGYSAIPAENNRWGSHRLWITPSVGGQTAYNSMEVNIVCP